ncbi:MAG: OmpA family protein [Verrucomicrobiales bacterium]
MNKTTALIFFGIIVVGIVVSVLTLGKFGKRVEVVDKEVVEERADPGEETRDRPEPVAADAASEEKAKKKGPQGQEETVDEAAGFASPEAAMAALAEKAGSRNFDEFVEAVGEESIPDSVRERLKTLIEDPKFVLDEEKPFTEISKSARSVRWALNFVPEGGGETQQLYTDLQDSEDGEFDVAKLSFPLELAGEDRRATSGTDAPEGTKASERSSATQGRIGDADPLTIAHAFSKAIVSRDFEAARALSDPEDVTDERVAALMIAVEEGKFALRESRPLVVTLSRDDLAWVLTRVQSGETASEFALELGRTEDSWAVNGLTFSKVLSTLASRGGGGDVAYSPIVEDPAGGDSLVLYFEFDEAGLTSRTSRQIAIVADILDQSSDRVIRINGHADALGTADYNAALSNRRAEAIRQAFIDMGVSPDQVITESFGDTRPRLPNFLPDGSDNPSGRSRNRRAEVYLDF